MPAHETFHESASPAERLGSAMLQLGLRPDLIADLAPDEARVVVSAIAKAFSTITHPDRHARNTVHGLEIGEVNLISAQINHADDPTLAGAISRINETSAAVSARRHNERLIEEIKELRDINETLAESVIKNGETFVDHLSMSLLIIDPWDDLKENPRENALSLRIQDGQVVEALSIGVYKKALLSTLSKDAQQKLLNIRPDETSTEQFVNLDPLFPNDNKLKGWAKLVTATSIKDPSVKKPAIKFYGTDNIDTYEQPDLIGCRIVGCFNYTVGERNGIELVSDTVYQNDISSTAYHRAGSEAYVRIRDKELAHLLGRGIVLPLTTQQDVQQTHRFVLRRPATKGRNAANFITSDVSACSIL